MSLRPISRVFIGAMLLGGLTPAISDAQPEQQQQQPQQGPGNIIDAAKGAGRNPKIIIVAPDNITPIFYIDCDFGSNIGVCLDENLNLNGQSFYGVDDNRIHTFVSGRAHLDSPLGALATLWNNYSYDELYIESDVRLRSAE